MLALEEHLSLRVWGVPRASRRGIPATPTCVLCPGAQEGYDDVEDVSEIDEEELSVGEGSRGNDEDRW